MQYLLRHCPQKQCQTSRNKKCCTLVDTIHDLYSDTLTKTVVGNVGNRMECAQHFFLSNIKWFQDSSECVDLFLFSGFQALTTSPTLTVTLCGLPPFYNTQWALLYRGRGKITMTPVIPAATVLQAQNRAADNQRKKKISHWFPSYISRYFSKVTLPCLSLLTTCSQYIHPKTTIIGKKYILTFRTRKCAA